MLSAISAITMSRRRTILFDEHLPGAPFTGGLNARLTPATQDRIALEKSAMKACVSVGM